MWECGPCEDGNVRWAFALFCVGCTAEVQEKPPDAAAGDAPLESVQMEIPCPQDPTLSICMAFDAPAFGSPYTNEGVVPVSANLTNVTRTATSTGGAALLGATSEIFVPMNTQITGIVAIDARVRLDEEIPTDGRVGLIDADKTTPGMSLFLYTGTTSPHRIRCNLGGVDLYAATTLTLGQFTNIGCTCEMGNVAVWKDGVKLVELGGATTCMPGVATTSGLQIGQNGRSGDGLPPNEPFVGAIDRVRLWTAVPAQ